MHRIPAVFLLFIICLSFLPVHNTTKAESFAQRERDRYGFGIWSHENLIPGWWQDNIFEHHGKDLEQFGYINLPIYWRGIEDPQGFFHFDSPFPNMNNLDTIMDMVAERNLRVIAVLMHTPKWANGGLSAAHPPKNVEVC